MSEDTLTTDDIRAMAAGIGLSKLTEAQLQQLQRVTGAKRSQPQVLRFAELTPADEPANAFRLAECAKPRPGAAK